MSILDDWIDLLKMSILDDWIDLLKWILCPHRTIDHNH